MPDRLLRNVFLGTNPAYFQKVESKQDEPCDFLEAFDAQINLFWREMKINKCTLKFNARQENFSHFRAQKAYISAWDFY